MAGHGAGSEGSHWAEGPRWGNVGPIPAIVLVQLWRSNRGFTSPHAIVLPCPEDVPGTYNVCSQTLVVCSDTLDGSTVDSSVAARALTNLDCQRIRLSRRSPQGRPISLMHAGVLMQGS